MQRARMKSMKLEDYQLICLKFSQESFAVEFHYHKSGAYARITASLLDIVDRGEIEEQLRLLQELVLERIFEKLESTRDGIVDVIYFVSWQCLEPI
ncbi:hypothetical protein F0562_002451 [Nyssa sinensis]|uniref:Uncharacterized protein n=1 Tax=Nyssa sinensis TaxID=561372 RepID=A0A5J5C9L2_9ASTE|nr:hypothetical protein F0562_002451 [Nyssa sinensis]